jgi:hypothetical protein
MDRAAARMFNRRAESSQGLAAQIWNLLYRRIEFVRRGARNRPRSGVVRGSARSHLGVVENLTCSHVSIEIMHMDQTRFSPHRLTWGFARVVVAVIGAGLLWPGGKLSLAGSRPSSVATVPKWSRFELTLQSSVVVNQPGFQRPRRHVAAATSETKDLTLVYVPEDRAIELSLATFSPSPTVSWFNPRTSERKPAIAVVRGKSCQFTPPEAGDWVLVSKTGK